MPQRRNAQCPRRSIGLTHTVDGGHDCVHCGAVTYAPEDPMDKLRAQSIEGMREPTFEVRLVAVVRPCDSCGRPAERRRSLCDDCTFMRRVMFQRHRHQMGALSEYPAVMPIDAESPLSAESIGAGSLDPWNAESIRAACLAR